MIHKMDVYMKSATRRGQILILVLLIVVVALAVGLSVAARNITNLRTSTQTEQSQRAFSAAEGGVEDVLSRLNAIVTSPALSDGQETYNIPVGNLQANVTVKASNVYQSIIDTGSVGQINLQGASGNLQIDWASCDDAIESPQPATLAVTQYIQNGTTYSQVRQIFQGDPFASRSESAGSVGFDTSIGYTCPSASGFRKSANVTVASNAVLLRIRPFWVKATVRVSGGGLQSQVYDITSTAKVVPSGSDPGTTGGVTRTVKVQRTALPQLPAAFDYVLFSGGTITK